MFSFCFPFFCQFLEIKKFEKIATFLGFSPKRFDSGRFLVRDGNRGSSGDPICPQNEHKKTHERTHGKKFILRTNKNQK